LACGNPQLDAFTFTSCARFWNHVQIVGFVCKLSESCEPWIFPTTRITNLLTCCNLQIDAFLHFRKTVLTGLQDKQKDKESCKKMMAACWFSRQTKRQRELQKDRRLLARSLLCMTKKIDILFTRW
jgi:hypothetical protein